MDGVNEANILTDPVSSATCPKCSTVLDVVGLPAFTAVQCPTCETEFQVPARFGNFLLLQLLGAGGMGGVYRARDEGLKREVAIKVMLKSLGDDPQFVTSFQREAQAAASLNHPNIAQIYSFGQEKGQPYIAMELVSGGSLDKMMAEQGPMNPTAVLQIGEQIAEGLQEAAEAGLVHGDVKPENILFDQEKNAKLVDFGLAAMNAGPGNDVWGTPYYIAPEKVRRQKIDFRSDIYSLGATLYHAIAGIPPFDGEDATAVVKARFEGPPKPLSEMRKKFPEEVEAFIKRMLEVEPQLRYPTYGSLLGDIRRYLAKSKPVKLTVTTKKIMIKGKRPKNMTDPSLPLGELAGDVPEGMEPVEQDVQEPESEEDASKRGLRMMVGIFVGIVVLIGVVGGGIFGGMKLMTANREKAAQAQLEKHQEKARVSIAKSIGQAQTLLERINAYVPEALATVKEAEEAVVAVLGEEVRASMKVPEPDFELPQTRLPQQPAATIPEVGDATNAMATVQDGGVTQRVDAAVAAGGASNAPPAVAGAETTNVTAGVAETPVAVAEKSEVAPVDIDSENLPPVIKIVRGMFEDAYRVKGGALLAQHLISELEVQAKQAESMTSPDQTKALVELANTLVQKVSGLPYVQEIADVARKTSQLKKTLLGVKADTAALVERNRQEAVELARQRQEEAAAEKKRQAQEAHREKVAAEREKVQAAEQANMETLRELSFRDAVKTLRELRSSLETDEGTTAATLAIDRVNRIKEFHSYLISKVKGFQSRRGWSVETADMKSLKVGSVNISWQDVYNKRPEIVAEFINELVRNDTATRDLKLSEKTKLLTNAALTLNLFYKELPSAQELAKQLATTAAQQFEIEAPIIKQLLPEFFTD